MFDLQLLVKAFIGFLLVFIIQLLSRTKYYFISALVPLFPSIAMFSYYFVGSVGDSIKLQRTIVFGMLSLIPYFSFLFALLVISKKLNIALSLACSSSV